ncbi:xanthine dehydrogenase family protein subunit M [Oceanicola sp. 502str15]|uniref:FAD binding domain-containing protein n=1 Tax=Oceanicola sp. 502str15 TaxID=2696061 RepID=UPI0020941071|nr:FAD binding domain-containing protein [Oceanicola sp. 502str15]MCO6381282.1 carbon monoxide dehydrogenase [Oceanicola sp. 502str15]
MKPAPFSHIRPDTAAAVSAGLSGESAKIIAGGQSLGPMLNLRLARPAKLVGLAALPGQAEISEEGGALVIGAGVIHARIEDGDSPVELPAMMRHVARGIAYRAVRNRGTLGGSLAHADPAADWVTTMTALDATLRLQGASGARATPMRGFMQGAYRTALAPGEFITAVEIAAPLRAPLWGYHKICRKVGEFADAIGAVVIEPASGYARIVAGATGAAPLLLPELAADLARSATAPAPARITEALAAALPGADRVKLHQLTTSLARAIDKVIAQ